MSKISGSKKWNIVVPVVDNNWSSPGRVTEYRIVETINAPTYELAIEEAEPIANQYIEKYINDTREKLDIKIDDDRSYVLRGKTLWRLQPADSHIGVNLSKYV